ncbi:olfactory receptor 6N1-like [Menidia menidia]
MLNSTPPTVSHFVLEAYLDVGGLRYLYFLVVLLVYGAIVTANLLLVVVICVNRSLHEPMYMFLCSLFVNELYGSTGLFPFLLVQILSDLHTVSAPLCFLQVFCLYSYATVEFCSLALMSYDRYVAICRPLAYSSCVTPGRAVVLIVGLWLYSSVRCVVNVSLSVRLRLCGNSLRSLYCQNYLIVRLACSEAQINNAAGLLSLVLSILLPLLAILFSYTRILTVCFSGSRNTRQKAASTCTPHLVSLLNFSFGCTFEILQSRFDSISVPHLKILLLFFVILQLLLNPVLYGMQMSKIRNVWKGYLHKNLSTPGGKLTL